MGSVKSKETEALSSPLDGTKFVVMFSEKIYMLTKKQKLMETFHDVISGEGLVLVDFFATWCQPCKMMHPVLEQVKAVLGDKIRIIKIDVDRHRDMAGAYRIESVPTLMLFRKGEMLYRQSGAMSKADLLALLDPFLK